MTGEASEGAGDLCIAAPVWTDASIGNATPMWAAQSPQGLPRCSSCEKLFPVDNFWELCLSDLSCFCFFAGVEAEETGLEDHFLEGAEPVPEEELTGRGGFGVKGVAVDLSVDADGFSGVSVDEDDF
ncbi:UNVERIFIED_CONTAM: hypothetical protein K2H54_069471 [Gekko kuhli]